MPLTNAERQKRYREKLKNKHPKKYAEVKKKNCERALKHYKEKTSNYSEEQKEEQRRKWREDSKKAKKQIVNDENNIRNTQRQVEYKLRQENTELRKKFKRMLKVYHTMRKRLYRQQKQLKEMSKNYDNIMIKLNTIEQKNTTQECTPQNSPRKMTEDLLSEIHIPTPQKKVLKKLVLEHNVLKQAISVEFKKSSNADKKVFKRVAKSTIVDKYKQKKGIASSLGLKNYPRNRDRKLKRNSFRDKITSFYLRDDVSRATAGKKEYKTYKKVKCQKRYLLDKLKILHKKFVSEVGQISFSTFKKYRPFFVLPPQLKDCDTCACLKHSNMQFQVNTLKSIGVIQQDGIHDFISSLVCDIKSKDCMYNECGICSTKELACDVPDLTKNVTWSAWVLKEHIYGEEGKEKKTKRMMKIIKEGTVKDLVKSINAELKKFKIHVFNFYFQYMQYKFCLDNLKSNEVLIHIDFSENYVCKHHKEVQAMHFGAAKVQITLHTGVLYIKNQTPLSFCTISPDNRHNPEAIWAHLDPILNYVRNNHENINTIHFYSDGPTTQYRQKKNFFLFSKNVFEYGFDVGTWSFFEAAHGKGAADGVGGAIKRNLDSFIAHGYDIPNAETAYNVLEKSETHIQIFYIHSNKITSIDPTIVENIRPLNNTMKIHQIITCEPLKVRYRHLSCFCNDKNGQCDCYSPLEHNFLSNERDSNVKTRKRKLDESKDDKRKKEKGRKTRKRSSSSEDDYNSDDLEYAESDDTNISDIPDLIADEIEEEYSTKSICPNKKIVLLSSTIIKPADANVEILSNIKNKLENMGKSDLTATLQTLDSRHKPKKESTRDSEETKYDTYDTGENFPHNPYNFDVEDSVIVRYYQRKTWRYYIGFIKNIEHKKDDTYYTIHYLKTITKPDFKFVVMKKLDMDILAHKNNSILKHVKLNKKGEAYYLCDDFDLIYFES